MRASSGGKVAPAVQLNDQPLNVSNNVLRKRFNAPSNRPSTPPKRNRPKGDGFRQQKLSTWRPTCSAPNAIICFLLVSLAAIPIGIILIIEANRIIEITIPYTHCLSNSALELSEDGNPVPVECAQWLHMAAFTAHANEQCICSVPITINESLNNEVIFYYGLDNFYQNHRRYFSSRNDAQLLGDLNNVQSCQPFTHTDDGSAILPCGAIANSMFNDTFELIYKQPREPAKADGVTPEAEPRYTDVSVPVTHRGILPYEFNMKFKNPAEKNLTKAFAGYAKPPAWKKRLEKLDETDPSNNGMRNFDFMVWMAAAALPSLRKPWRKLERNASDLFTGGLRAGNYTLQIRYNYPVMQFDGDKRFVIMTESWLGSKNFFSGVAFCSVGIICLINAVVFCIIRLKFGTAVVVVR